MTTKVKLAGNWSSTILFLFTATCDWLVLLVLQIKKSQHNLRISLLYALYILYRKVKCMIYPYYLGCDVVSDNVWTWKIGWTVSSFNFQLQYGMKFFFGRQFDQWVMTHESSIMLLILVHAIMNYAYFYVPITQSKNRTCESHGGW